MKIKLELEKMSVPSKIEFAKKVVNSMSGNPNFLYPEPALEVVMIKTLQLEDLYNETIWKTDALVEKKISETEKSLDGYLIRLKKYVEKISYNDSTKIYTSGFKCKERTHLCTNHLVQYGMKIMRESLAKHKERFAVTEINNVKFL